MLLLAISVEERDTSPDIAIKIASVSHRSSQDPMQRYPSCPSNQHQPSEPQQTDKTGRKQLVMQKPISAICIGGYRVEGKVNGVSMKFLVDSGAAITLIRSEIWASISKNHPQELSAYRTDWVSGSRGIIADSFMVVPL